MDSYAVRIAVTVFACLAIGLAVAVWRNAAAPDALTNVGIALAALLPACIAVFPYFISESLSKTSKIALFIDSKSDRLTFGEPLGPYDLTVGMLFVNLSKVSPSVRAITRSDFEGEKGLDAIEYGILTSIAIYFQANWDFEIEKYSLPAGESRELPAASKTPGTKISAAELRKKFRHNRLFDKPDVFAFNSFSLPPGSIIQSTHELGQRVITVSTDTAICTINIRRGVGMVAQKGINGVIVPDPTDMNRYWMQSYDVRSTMTSKWLKRHSPSMPGNKRWFAAVTGIIHDFSWEAVSKKLEIPR